MDKNNKLKQSNTDVTLECLICCDNNENVHIMCDNSHAFCSSCINMYFEQIIIDNPDDDNRNINLNCAQVGCDKQFYEEILMMCLKDELSFLITKSYALKKIDYPKDLFPLDCPLCPKNSEALVLIDTKDFPNYHTCFMCDKAFCLYCLRDKSKHSHSDCKKYYKAYLDLQIYSKVCAGFNCLNCKSNLSFFNLNSKVLAKVRSCNHLTCQKCNIISCYICGGADLLNHHDNYKTNINNCPMYLYDLRNIEELKDWPSIDETAHEKFNEYRKVSFINKTIKKYGKDYIIKTYENYSHALNALGKDVFDIPNDFKPLKYLEDRIYNFYKI
jgi:hypothetical protein